MRTSPIRRLTGVAGALLLGVSLLAACSDSSDDEAEVASLDQPSAAAASAESAADPSATAGDVEAELLAYTQCLRDQGLDVPDPEVDAEGNLVLGGGGPGGGAGDPGDDGGAGGAPLDADQFAAAQEVCGDPPAGLTSVVDQLDSPEFQDALLAFTTCLRDKGYDVADIELGGGGPGPGGANPLGDLDLNDPTVAADVDQCQSSAFAGLDLPLPGAGG